MWTIYNYEVISFVPLQFYLRIFWIFVMRMQNFIKTNSSSSIAIRFSCIHYPLSGVILYPSCDSLCIFLYWLLHIVNFPSSVIDKLSFNNKQSKFMLI